MLTLALVMQEQSELAQKYDMDLINNSISQQNICQKVDAFFCKPPRNSLNLNGCFLFVCLCDSTQTVSPHTASESTESTKSMISALEHLKSEESCFVARSND